MKWPWVSRARAEVDAERQNQEGFWQGVASRAQEEVKAERARYDALLDKYHALKLAGAAIPEPKPEPAPKPQPDPVTQAIIAKAGTSRALRKHYADFVTEQRTAGKPDEEIAQAITRGQDDADGVPG